MANMREYHRSFGGGEVSPYMYGRLDDSAYQTGAALMRNFLALPQGPAENRPGTSFIRATKANGKSRIIPFIFSATQTYVLEIGIGYIRITASGATLLNTGAPTIVLGTTIAVAGQVYAYGGTTYWCRNSLSPVTVDPATDPANWYAQPTTAFEIPTSYAEADLFDIHYVQSNDVLTLVHPNYPPAELRRYANDRWMLSQIAFVPSVSAPSGVSATGTTGEQLMVTTMPYASPTVLNTPTNHQFAAGDPLYLNAFTLQGTTTNSPSPFPATQQVGAIPTDGFYVANTASGSTLQLKDYNTGQALTFLAGKTSTTVQFGANQVIWTGHGLVVGTPIYFTTNPAAAGVFQNFQYWVSSPVNVNSFTLAPSYAEAISGSNIGITALAVNHTAVVNSYNGNSGRISFGSRISDLTNQYVVTTVSSAGVESAASAIASVANNLYANGAFNTIAWTAVAGAARYNVYKAQSGLYGYIGQTSTTTFVDNNIAPDMGQTPPIYDTVFASAGNYPGAVSYYEQRRVFASTLNDPQYLWLTRSGTEVDMSYSIPSTDADRIALRVASREASIIRHVVPLTQLLLLTSAAEWRVSPANSDVLTPSTISVRPQSYVGANNVQPQIVNNTVVYVSARGGHVRELGYSWQASGFVTGNLSLRASHLFNTFDIVDMAFAKSPRQILWFVSTSGKLLGLTYVPEEQIGAWHQHDTDGTFESVAAIPEGLEDAVYVVVRRTVNGATVRYLERFATRVVTDLARGVFTDSSLTYDGANTTSDTMRLTNQSATVTMTVASPAVVTWTGHSLVAGNAVTFQTTGSLPGGIVPGQMYYVVNPAANTFQVAATKGGTPITTVGGQTGIHTASTAYTADNLLTMTASAPRFLNPVGTDLNDAIVLVGSDGTKYRATILGTSSTTVATVRLDKAVPASLQDTATTAWEFARERVTGLSHLEGKTVSILADGAVFPQQVVTGGTVTINRAASVITVGLPVTADLQTLPMAAAIDGFAQGRMKNVNKAWLRMYRSSGVFIGPDADNLVESKSRTTEPFGTPPSLVSDEIMVVMSPKWASTGQVFVRQKDPLPLTILSMTTEVSVGG